MPPRERAICPECGGKKDHRAKRCVKCRPSGRLGTGKGWYLHKPTGYMIGCFGNGHVYQHRLVMEKYLGRSLQKGEVVHHIDGDKTNNTLENLELALGSVHSAHHMTSKRAKEMSIKGHQARWGWEDESCI